VSRPRAMVLDSPAPAHTSPLVERSRESREPAPDEILVGVRACGVCRTDLQLVEGDLALHRHPIVPGHQVVGEVLAAGTEAGHVAGERVGVTWLAGACGECDHCEEGRENLCLRATFHGWDHDGGYADEMLVSGRFAFTLDSARPDDEIAPLLCAGVIGHRALKLTGVGAGERLGLYGFGSSASLVLQFAIAAGVEVHVVTRNPAELERALALGAVSARTYGEVPPPELHAAITFAPVGSVVVEALGSLRRGGTVVVNAIHLDEVPAFDYDLLWHERVVRSVANVTRTDIRELLELAAAHPPSVEPSIYRLTDANRALVDLADGTISGPGVLIP